MSFQVFPARSFWEAIFNISLLSQNLLFGCKKTHLIGYFKDKNRSQKRMAGLFLRFHIEALSYLESIQAGIIGLFCLNFITFGIHIFIANTSPHFRNLYICFGFRAWVPEISHFVCALLVFVPLPCSTRTSSISLVSTLMLTLNTGLRKWFVHPFLSFVYLEEQHIYYILNKTTTYIFVWCRPFCFQYQML